MPTATVTSPGRESRRAKGARTAASRRTSAASRRASATTRARKATRSKRTKATRANAARASTATAVPVARYRTTSSFGDYAERAVLIPVGAALTARDRVLSSVNEAISSYSSPTRAQAQLRRFERRGATARKRLEREVRKARVRVERELRQRRREIEKTVSDLEDRRETVAKNGTELANRVQERVVNLV